MNEPLDTERLSLRPFRADDLEAWHAIWGDPEVIWWGPSPHLDESRKTFEGLLRHEAEVWPEGIGWLAVTEKGSDEIIGDVLLQPAPFVDGIEVGWHFHRRVWGQGYATEAARAVIEHAFARGTVERIYAIVATRNAAALRVARKLGMRRVADQEYAGMPHRLFMIKAPKAPAG